MTTKSRPKPPSQKRVTVKEVAAALRKARGMVSVAARELGVSRRTIYNYRAKSPIVQEALEDSREHTTDVAELKLFEAITKGEPWAISLYLRTQGRHRGYVETTNVNHSGSLTVEAIAKLSDEEVERLAVERGLPELE